MRKVALITGITGQDGSYLADMLIAKGYEVHGIIRRSSSINTERLNLIYSDPHGGETKLNLHYGDLTDGSSLCRLLEKILPTEIYNLGAQSHVRVSFDIPEYTVDATGMGTLRLLEAMRTVKCRARFYQAGSSEMFGGLFDGNTILNETCRFHPRSPYGCAKVFSHNIAVNYRESYGMHISNGILFNHESARRGTTFVTRKITKFVAGLLNKASGLQTLYLGNLVAKRDWGYAPEYVRAMWLMLQQEEPDDYVIATGKTYSVVDFLEAAFKVVGIDNWKKYVVVDPHYFRPAEVEVLVGDASKARQILGWVPTVEMEKLARIMVEADAYGENMEDVRALWTS
jgi:GDPmannose 4,6-dehydratase